MKKEKHDEGLTKASPEQNQEKTGLTVRRMTEQDLEPLCVLLSDPDVMRFLEPPYSIEQTRAFLIRAMSDHPPVYAVDMNGHFIGYVIDHPYDEESMEAGWVLFPEHWGKGYASILTRQMIEKAGRQGKSLVIECDPTQSITKHIALKHGFVLSERKDGLDVYILHTDLTGSCL